MRLVITCFIFSIFSGALLGQITIERSDYTMQAGTRITAWRLDYSNAMLPAEGEGLVWDYSSLPLEDGFFTDFLAASNDSIPSANIMFTNFGGVLGLPEPRPINTFQLLDETGYGTVGTIHPEVRAPLGAFTGGAEDTLISREVVNVHPQRSSTIQFPLNFGDTWAYERDVNFNFEVSVAAFGLQGAPAGQLTRDSTVVSVVGHGTLILPNPGGIGLEPVSMEVLQVKEERVTTFTYTLAGQPAPPAMLNLLNIEQGEVQAFTRYYFFAKGLPRSAASIRFDQEGNIVLFNISDEVKNLVSSTADIQSEMVPVKAFPNPNQGRFQLRFDKPDAQSWTLDVYNFLGQSVHRQVIADQSGSIHTTVQTASLPAGQYRYILRNTAGRLMAAGNVVMN